MTAARNPLAAPLVESLRDLRDAKNQVASYRELACAAIALLAERDRQFQAKQRVVESLRDELRRYTSDRTCRDLAA